CLPRDPHPQGGGEAGGAVRERVPGVHGADGPVLPTPEGRGMNLAIFDIDGTLTESVAVDEVCFVQAFRDVLGVEGINTNWLDYPFQTDSGLAREIGRKHLGRDPSAGEIGLLQRRFLELLRAAGERDGQALREVPGAAAFLTHLRAKRPWRIAVATGGWA